MIVSVYMAPWLTGAKPCYLELNLASEAIAIYERLTPALTELRMRAELARAVLNQGRARLMLGRYPEAYTLLTKARRFYIDEGNVVGAAMV